MPHPHQPFWFRIGQGVRQYAIDNTEDSRIGTNSQAQGEYSNGSESGRSRETAENVFPHARSLRTLAESFMRARYNQHSVDSMDELIKRLEAEIAQLENELRSNFLARSCGPASMAISVKTLNTTQPRNARHG